MNVAERQDAELLTLIVEDMAAQRFHVQMGKHRNGNGYWALFWQPTNVECLACHQPVVPRWWNDCGHASTLLNAVIEARELALGIRRLPALPPAFFFGRRDE